MLTREHIYILRYFWIEVFRYINRFTLRKFRLICKAFKQIIDEYSPLSLTDSQKSVLNSLLHSNEKILKLKAPMSFGKTVIAIKYGMAYEGHVVIFTLPALVSQWEEEAIKWLGTSKDFLFGYSSYKQAHFNKLKEYIGFSIPPEEKFIVVTRNQRIIYKAMKLLVNPLIIIDESHKNKEGILYNFCDLDVGRVLAITASEEDHGLYKETISVKEAEVLSSIPEWNSEYIYIENGAWKESLDSYLQNSLFKNLSLEGKTLVFCCLLDVKLTATTKEAMVFKDPKDPMKFKNNEKKYLLINGRKSIEGINLPQAKNVIILFPEHASGERVQQLIGRATRVTSTSERVRVIAVIEDLNPMKAIGKIHMMRKDIGERYYRELEIKSYRYAFTEDKWNYALNKNLDDFQYMVLFSKLSKKNENKYKKIFGKDFPFDSLCYTQN